MTGQDVVTRWRGMVNDDIIEYRYADSQARTWLNDAVVELLDNRPDLGMDDDNTMLAMVPLTALSQTLTLPTDMQRPLAYLMTAYMYEDAGSADANLQAAQATRKLFLSMI